MGNNKKKKQISLKISTIAFFIIVVIVIINLVYKSELPIVSQFRNSDITTDALADTPPVYPAGEILYLPVTMFKYNTDEFNSLTRAEEGSTQGIYFNNRNGNNTIEIDGNSRISCEAYNHYSSSQTTGMVKNELDSSGNIQFNYPEIGIFDETTNRGKTVYQNVLLPFTSQGNGTYIMDSDNEDINFTNGIPQSGVKLEKNENKNTYNNATEATVWGSRNVNGFFPFNSKNGEDAIYHFGVKTEINFYMSSNGKTKTENPEDIIFRFSGDDDLWVFIDGKLVIDLGGIHDKLEQEINFATRKVIGYTNSWWGGSSSETTIANLDDLIGDDLYSDETKEHTLSIFYLERGQGGSNCTIEFNLPKTFEPAQLTVHHYIENTEELVAPDESYEYKVGDSYETKPAENLDEKYELIKTPSNASGIVTSTEVEVIYYYRIKSYNITTKIDGTGGNISGAGDTPYEIVEYGEDSTKPIIITPDEGYIIKTITINGEEIEFEPDYDGSYTLDKFQDVKENKEVVVSFENTIGKVDVNHYLYTKEDGLTTTTITDTDHLKGKIGENYETSPKTDLEYVLITNEEYYDAISEELPEGVIGTDSYIPENSIGTYEDGETQIVNYYYKVKTYTLTVHHYLEGTEVKVPLKGGTEGKVVEDEITEGLIKNEEYTTSKASEDKIDYDIYELVEEPNNANGYIQDNTEVTYYYKVKTASITITKVAEENYQTVLPNTKFKLYRLTNKDSSEKDELINKINPQDCWTLVDEYVTSETGKITLPDLPINEEYRLVETKAAGNRLIPDGQWKIEFIYGNYDKEDNTIVRINGTNIRITAIGNPPALAETDSKELLLPNKKMFVFPSSGSLGTKEIYEIGLGIMIAGGIFLITRKALVIIDSNRKEKGLKPLVKIKTKHDRKQK